MMWLKKKKLKLGEWTENGIKGDKQMKKWWLDMPSALHDIHIKQHWNLHGWCTSTINFWKEKLNINCQN